MKKSLTYTVEVTLDEDEIKVLETLNTTPQYPDVKSGWWEFRSSRSYNGMCRGGILKETAAFSLEDKGFLEFDDMAWHTTFHLTDKGKEIYEKHIK
jgi:hypothetical protein